MLTMSLSASDTSGGMAAVTMLRPTSGTVEALASDSEDDVLESLVYSKLVELCNIDGTILAAEIASGLKG